MTDKQIIIDGVDVSKWTDEEIRYNFEKHSPKAIRQIAFDLYKQLARKEQECEKLKKYLHQNFKEKDKLHLIIDRLLEASGYDTNTASAEDFEDVYENMRYEKQQLDQFKQTLAEIKEIAEKQCNICEALTPIDEYKDCQKCWQGVILQKISEVIPND